jgi:cytoskeleton-associated protein 5
LNTCAVKLNVAHNVYLNSQDCHVDEIFKLFKSLFSVIIDIFESELGKHTNTKTLKDVFYNLLCVMTDAKILNYPDGDQLIKAINIVTLKLLELSDQTTSYCALVKLLSECCNDENFSSKYLELVMKCIWRQIRRLSSSNTNPAAQQAFENLMQQIDTSRVFGEIHAFFKMYPSSSWQSKSSDLPLRTVKTLLFHLAKAKQSQVLDDLNKIRVPDDSEIKVYIMKLFKNGFQLSNNNNNTSSNLTGNNISFGFGGSAKAGMKQDNLSPDIIKGTSPSVATRELGDQLSAIIKKIGNSETSKEGLAELYEFKQRNPDIELNKYFKNSSGKLQAYIQEHLKLIEQERNGTDKCLTSDVSSNGPLFAKNIVNNKSPERTNGSEFRTEFKQSTNLNRNVDDIMKTIADWKSKTHLNKLDDEDNDENNIRSTTAGLNGDYKFANSNTNRLFELYKSNGNSKSNSNGNGNGNYVLESENSIKAEKYLDIVKDLKKKYTRSRTEVSLTFY